MLGLKHFRQDGCLSYLIFDPETREAALIDPNAELMADYREAIAEARLKVLFALDTHTHADHFSGSHLFRDEYGAGIAMSTHSRSARVTLRLANGDLLKVGKVEVSALETPGHTLDSMCFLVRSGELSMVFTGDTLFIGSSGRTDFPGADPAQQWETFHRVLEALPASTLVYPGHDYSDLLFSTLGTERRKNPHWNMARDEFIAFKRSEQIPNPDSEIQKRIAYNFEAHPTLQPVRGAGAATACGKASSEPDRAASIGVDKYKHKLEEKSDGTRFVDVREAYEFREGHMPGAENIPLSELGLRLPELSRAQRIYVSCLSGRRSSMAARTLAYLELPDVVNVTGGFKAWIKAGNRTA
jgi:glyoxylase-like metal-dependent hydrolase (beta-lactamase superfamily II)/rhodanese-related sulfurtransferase